jgi:hypothetical protein
MESKYREGQKVWINRVYVLEETLKTVALKVPVIAEVKKVKQRCSEPFGTPYVLILPENITTVYSCAPICYWGSDIMCELDEEEELFWKIWGDQ